MNWRIGVVLVSGTFACADVDEPNAATQVCVTAADAAVTAEVAQECPRGTELGCSWERDGLSLVLATRTGGRPLRSDTCESLYTECEIDELAPGPYTVEFAGEGLFEFELPDESEDCWFAGSQDDG